MKTVAEDVITTRFTLDSFVATSRILTVPLTAGAMIVSSKGSGYRTRKGLAEAGDGTDIMAAYRSGIRDW